MFDFTIQVIAVSGLLGVAFLMLLENVFPPIPSELIMPVAGFAAARGHFDLAPVVLCGTGGAVLGAALWYWIGRGFGHARLRRWAASHGRWLTLTPAEVDRAARVFRRFGGPAVLLGRLLPGVRTFISIPAGVTEMPLAPFLVWSTVGTGLFTFALAYAGFRLEAHYEQVADWMNPVAAVILVAAIVTYLVRVVTFRADDDEPA